MWLYSAPDCFASGSPRGPNRRLRTRGTRCRSARPPLSLEALEDRTLPSVAPLPIPGGALIPNPFGGPDAHFNRPGPADSTVPGTGGEPSAITDFNGFVGVVRVDGSGTDGDGNPLLWEVDLRFMRGVYQGADGRVHTGTFALV